MADSLREPSGGIHILRRMPNSGLGRDPGGAIRTLLFFILFYSYLWLYLDLRLVYYSAGMVTRFPVFFRGWTFFGRFTSYPGGPGEYVAAFLAQLFYYSWAAALVVTVQALVIFLCIGYFLKAVNASSLCFLRFVVPILLLIVCSQYTYHFAVTTTISVALLSLCLYLRITPPNKPGTTDGQPAASLRQIIILRTAAIFIVLSAILYYVAGAAYLLFAVLCAIRELRFKRRVLAIVYLLCAAAVPYIEGVLIFGVCISKAFTESLPSSWKIGFLKGRKTSITPTYALFMIASIGVFVAGLWRFFAGGPARKTTPPERKKGKKGKARRKSFDPLDTVLSWRARAGVFKWAAESLLVFLIVGAAAFFSHDSKRESMLEIHCYACRRMWPEVLRAAGHKLTPYPAINAVNRALYHTGRLGSQMFAYPQHPDALLLTGDDRILVFWHKFDTQLDLGLTNLAQMNLIECMEVYGEHPLILKRLALINMVKHNTGAAKIYLTALTKTFFHDDWARDYLALLETDPELSTDRRVQKLRSVRMKKDHPVVSFATEKMLLTLLSENGKNKMAFEYLMSSYLLTKQLEKFIGQLGRLNELGYSQLPRHYQEAICIYTYGKDTPVFLHGYSVDPQVLREIEHFTKIFNQYGQNKQAAIHPLVQEFSGSYFFYHLYGFSGIRK